MYFKNNSGPKTVPWETPDVTGEFSDFSPSMMTVYWRAVRKFPIQVLMLFLKPRRFNMVSKRW